MQEATGHVTVNERVPTERFHRFVEEKLKDWIRDHGLNESQTEFEVAFFDEESLGEVSCLVVIHAGDNLWRSWETADNPRIALARTLENLKIEDERPVSDVQH
ncbi:MAG: hypothetical protein V4760_13085 [Bdellovibrionota bacterium]